MSFRSVSALPTCLHARLAFRRSACLRGFEGRQKCRNQSASIVFDSGNNVVTAGAITSPPYEVTGGSKPEEKTNATDAPSLDAPGFNTLSGATRGGIKSGRPAESEARTGTVLGVPEFMRPFHEPSPSNVRTQKPEHTPARYKEWEELHDRFLETRRTCPDQTSQIFSKECMIVRRFLGENRLDPASALEFKCKWLALSVEERHGLLPTLLIGSLVESAAICLFVLQNVHSMAMSSLIRMNCLRHISLMYWRDLQQDRQLRRTYEEQIGMLRSSKSWPQGRLPPVLFQNLLFWSTPEQCSLMIEDFLAQSPNVEPSSLVAIVDHYIRIKDPESALKYLSQLPEDLLREPDTNVQNLRDGLVKLDVVAKMDSGTNFKYLPQLLALGIPSDEALHNTVIESAILNGLPDVAWDLYRYLENSEFQINARSHLVLLRDAFHRGELQRVNEIMTAIHNHENLVSDQYLMAYSMNIVRNISYYEKQLEPHEARAHIMALYDRAYDRAPLVRTGIVKPAADQAENPQPSPTLLAFTIWTLVLIQRRDPPAIRLWEWIKYLISNHDKALLEAARYDILYNAIVLFHSRKLSSLSRALEVVQYMLSSKICLPTSRTWSILLCAFLKHGQVEQAQRIITLMQSKGFDVHEVDEKYGSYVPMGYDLTSLANRVKQNLDERDMPTGIEELLADCNSLQREPSARTYSSPLY